MIIKWASTEEHSEHCGHIAFGQATQSCIFIRMLIVKDTCTPMFIAVLFTIAKAWKQPKCPSTDEWIKKMWYIYTME